MSEDNIQSIFTFSQDVDTQEAPPPLPIGTYLASVEGAEPKVSKTSGNTYIDVTFVVAPDQFAPDFAAINPDAVKLHYRSLVMKDDARSRYALRKFCDAMRVPVKREFDVNALIGKAAMVKVKHEPYQGNTNAVIEAVEPA